VKILYKSNKLEFIFGDVFKYNFNKKFDMIICFSTFHYFIDAQHDFFNLCHNLLNDKGVLLLEVEEYPKNEIAIIDKSLRPADKISCDYPNNLMIQKFSDGKFNILERYISTFQGGALYDRYFYKLERI
jgi:cyclopropane fatty-acyl-phospholipid synthase-like methyltransferase